MREMDTNKMRGEASERGEEGNGTGHSRRSISVNLSTELVADGVKKRLMVGLI